MEINKKQSLKDALKKMSIEGKKCLIVIDDKKKFLGTLSDGDIRKALLKGKNLKTLIKDFFNSKSTFFTESNFKESDAKELFQKERFEVIPVIKKNGEILKILEWTDYFGPKQRDNDLKGVPVVIMAGGKGTRLKPFTQILPKPLIPINNKTVLERIIEPFHFSGANNFFLTVNYKARILKAFFEELEPDFKVNFIEEKKPLGTAGSIKNIPKKIKSSFFVTNCDVIFKVDSKEIMNFHNTNNFDITLVASTKEITIPYGVCNTFKNGQLNNIEEKPTFDYLVNTGLYILKPELLKLIPKNKYFDMTDLINAAKKRGKKIGVFPIDENEWVDVGQWEEYEKAKSRLE